MISAQLRQSFQNDGYLVLEEILTEEEAAALTEATAELVEDGAGGSRALLSVPAVREFAWSEKALGLARFLLSPKARPTRGIFFDKQPGANWKVPWHQDRMIPVRERIEVEGYGSWSVKDGVPHTQPPTHVLERVVTLRFHLDDCGPDNGALKVLPGSHWLGKISREDGLRIVSESEPTVCCVRRKGLVVMQPLLLHASSPSEAPTHRRVIHIEYSDATLDGGLRWPDVESPEAR